MLAGDPDAVKALWEIRRLIARLDVSASPIPTRWDTVLVYNGSINIRMTIKGRDLEDVAKAQYVYLDVRIDPKAPISSVLGHMVHAWARLFQHEALETLRIVGDDNKIRPIVPPHKVQDFSPTFNLREVLGL